VPEGSELPFDKTKYGTYPQYTKNPDTGKWDYSQGGEHKLPFNPLDNKTDGIYVFNPSTNKWEWYESESKVPFDYVSGDKPYYLYDPITKTWRGIKKNPYEVMFKDKGQYIEGGDNVTKLYQGQFIVSPSYLVSKDKRI